VPTVHFANWKRLVKAGPLASLRDVARLAGVNLHNGASQVMNCGGHGLCGTCRVTVEPLEALTPPTPFERMRGCTGPYRLACQARIASERIPVIHVVKRTGFSGKGRAPVPGPGIPETPKNAVPAPRPGPSSVS
jgi:ferredoxin